MKAEGTLTTRVGKPYAKGQLWRRMLRARYLYLLLLPGVAYYVVFHYIPIYGITLAFKQFKPNLGITASPFVGLRNFEFLMIDPEFFRAFTNTLIISAGRLLLEFPAPILLALFFNELRQGALKRTLQTVYTFPHFLSWVVMGSMLINVFGDQGALNALLGALGQSELHVFSNQKLFRPFLYLTNIWKEAGWSSIIYLAAISAIDMEQYESAEIDGITRWQKMRYITLPGISATVAIMFILAVGNVMNAGFDQVFILYNGTVLKVADIIDTYIYRITFEGPTDFSFSTAVGLFKSVINFVFLIVADRVTRAVAGHGLFV